MANAKKLTELEGKIVDTLSSKVEAIFQMIDELQLENKGYQLRTLDQRIFDVEQTLNVLKSYKAWNQLPGKIFGGGLAKKENDPVRDGEGKSGVASADLSAFTQLISNYIHNMERNMSVAGDMILLALPPIFDQKDPQPATVFRWMLKYHHVAKVASRLQITNLLGPAYSFWLTDDTLDNEAFDEDRYQIWGTNVRILPHPAPERNRQ